MTAHLVHIHHIYISPEHNYFGHHGQGAGEYEAVECAEVSCVAGSGIAGDRFFNYKPDYKGQITFFDWAVYLEMLEQYKPKCFPASAFRRNVIMAGIPLDQLIGKRFRLGGVVFQGSEECKPCYWMDEAVGAGAEAVLKGRGGLRARIVESGLLAKGAHTLEIIC